MFRVMLNIVKHLAMSVAKSIARSFVFTQDDTIAVNICIIGLLL